MRPERGRQVNGWAGWAGVLAVLLLSIAAATGVARAQTRFNFAVMSGAGAGSSDVAALARSLEQIEAANVAVILHTGNLKGGAEVCSDALYEQRKALLDGAARPLVFVPGSADWVDCETPQAGNFDATERLGRLRELFFDSDHALGQERLRLARQSELARFRGYPENVRWQIGKVMFVGLNLPGANNHYRAAAGRNAEFDDRLIASKLWLERAFHAAQRERATGLVILVHADPQFEAAAARRGVGRDGYAEFRGWLRDLCPGFTGQVLLVHDEAAQTRHDQPLRSARGAPVGNFTRLAVPEGSWVQVRVDARQTGARMFVPVLRRPR